MVLSRGGYTSAIDLWSLGCIFGELLQRVAGLGAASTPQLQVAPMFAIQGKPKTPSDGYAAASVEVCIWVVRCAKKQCAQKQGLLPCNGGCSTFCSLCAQACKAQHSIQFTGRTLIGTKWTADAACKLAYFVHHCRYLQHLLACLFPAGTPWSAW